MVPLFQNSEFFYSAHKNECPGWKFLNLHTVDSWDRDQLLFVAGEGYQAQMIFDFWSSLNFGQVTDRHTESDA